MDYDFTSLWLAAIGLKAKEDFFLEASDFLDDLLMGDIGRTFLRFLFGMVRKKSKHDPCFDYWDVHGT